LATEFDPNTELYIIRNLDDSSAVFKKLKALEKKVLNHKKSLINSKTYNGNEFHYILTLEKLLSLLPSDLEEMPSCLTLYYSILNGDKTSWKNQSQPTHKVWETFEKICKLSSD
jgi:hypothetical protein